MTRLRVASFNVRNGRAIDGAHSWPFRRRSCAAIIASLDADVVGLQEVFAFQQRWLLRALDGYVANGQGRSARLGGERCPVLTRLPVRVVEHQTRWYSDQTDLPGSRLEGATFPRIATVCMLELVPSSEMVQLSNTHLDERSAKRRRRSLQQLVTWLDPHLPQVLVGDLNAEPGAPELEPLVRAGLRPAIPAGAGGTAHDFTGRADGRRLDHVLISDHFDVLSAGVSMSPAGSPLPSDHWPVVADLRLRPSPSP